MPLRGSAEQLWDRLMPTGRRTSATQRPARGSPVRVSSPSTHVKNAVFLRVFLRGWKRRGVVILVSINSTFKETKAGNNRVLSGKWTHAHLKALFLDRDGFLSAFKILSGFKFSFFKSV